MAVRVVESDNVRMNLLLAAGRTRVRWRLTLALIICVVAILPLTTPHRDAVSSSAVYFCERTCVLAQPTCVGCLDSSLIGLECESCAADRRRSVCVRECEVASRARTCAHVRARVRTRVHLCRKHSSSLSAGCACARKLADSPQLDNKRAQKRWRARVFAPTDAATCARDANWSPFDLRVSAYARRVCHSSARARGQPKFVVLVSKSLRVSKKWTRRWTLRAQIAPPPRPAKTRHDGDGAGSESASAIATKIMLTQHSNANTSSAAIR